MRPGRGEGGGENAEGHLLLRHTRCGRKRNSRAQLPLAPAQRSAMAAEDVDGLAVSRPHYGCEYQGSGNSRSRQAAPSPGCPCLPGSSAGRGGWAAAGMRGRAGSRLRACPAGAVRPAGSLCGPRRAAPPARWAPCRAGICRSSTVLLSAGHKCWEKAVDGQRRDVPRLCRRRLPRAGSAPRPRCPPRAGRGRPCLPPSRRFWRPHPICLAKHRSHRTPSLPCLRLAAEGEAVDLVVRRAGSPVLRYRIKNDQRRRRTWCCGGAML